MSGSIDDEKPRHGLQKRRLKHLCDQDPGHTGTSRTVHCHAFGFCQRCDADTHPSFEALAGKSMLRRDAGPAPTGAFRMRRDSTRTRRPCEFKHTDEKLDFEVP
jgi:hypothetical protein